MMLIDIYYLANI